MMLEGRKDMSGLAGSHYRLLDRPSQVLGDDDGISGCFELADGSPSRNVMMRFIN